MAAASRESLRDRLTRVRRALAESRLDALLVTDLANVRYLTGFSGTAASLIVSSSRARLVVDFRYGSAAASLPGAGDAGLFTVAVADAGVDETVIAAIGRDGLRRIAIEAASMPVARFNRLSAGLAAGGVSGAPPRADVPECPSLVPTEQLVERIRAVKDAGEISTLREAARRLSAVARLAPRLVTPGRSEREIAADVEAALRQAGFDRPAFETIVASGPNSALPHARPTGRLVEAGEGVVLDFGGVYDGYCVDITRTLQTGQASAGFRRMFAAVAEAHAAALAAIRPGVRASEIDAAARTVLGRHGLGEAFGHGTGHGLGLEVHEGPRITKAATADPDAVIEAGMVFTIEPGAYVAGVGGVRIEDDVLVVETGAEVLTDVPIELAGSRQ
jgi:Xaa-Pro aminopeptidase